MRKNLIDRFHIYNKGMEQIDWDDVNVLRKLPDGWYSVASDSKYGEMIIDPSKVRDAILQGVQNYWDERAAIAITHTNYYKEW